MSPAVRRAGAGAVALAFLGVAGARGQVVISEFCTRGPNGDADEFVELYNNSDSPVSISGWRLNTCNCASESARAPFGGFTIQPRSWFLIVTPNCKRGCFDIIYSMNAPNTGGFVLINSSGDEVDRVGTCETCSEGEPLPPHSASGNWSYERRNTGDACVLRDTGDNLSDFVFRSPADPQGSCNGMCGEAPCDYHPCDTNCDGSINGFDIQPFIELMLPGPNPCSACAGDANEDGSVNGFDIQPFVECL